MSAAAGAVVTVAIPVRNGGALLAGVLDAVRAQRVDAEVELLVADSASSDGSRERALAAGARVIDIARGEFGHGATRNLLMREARGARVAMLTQDAEPADERWLGRLLEAFDAAEDVGLAFGPYLARPGASPAVRRDLERWFGSLAPGVERLGADERDLAAVELMGRRGFFSDANACIDRAAWERVPFRDIAYAEDRALALDMLRAGFAKVYEPRAAVLHSHAYGPREHFRRVFDEWSGLREVYGWREPASPARLIGRLRGELGARRREGAGAGALTAAGCGELSRYLAAVLGSRSGELPARLRRSLSLEARRR